MGVEARELATLASYWAATKVRDGVTEWLRAEFASEDFGVFFGDFQQPYGWSSGNPQSLLPRSDRTGTDVEGLGKDTL